MPKLKRPLYGPDTARGPSRGLDVVAIKRGLWHHPGLEFERPAAGFDDVYNRKTARAVKTAQLLAGIKPRTGNMGQATLDALWPFVDDLGRALYKRFKLAPVVLRAFPLEAGVDVRNFGGVAAHMARAMGNWQSDNAVDLGAPEGTAILAPFPGFVSRISGSDPAEGPHGTIFGQSMTITSSGSPAGAVFCTHEKLHPLTELGERVRAGEHLAWIADFGPRGRWPEHLHIAFERGNPETLWDLPRVDPIPADRDDL